MTVAASVLKTRACCFSPASNQLTVLQYVQALLQRIRQRDAVVKGWAFLDEALVLARAKELDAMPREARGPLHGLAVAGEVVLLYAQPVEKELTSFAFRQSRMSYSQKVGNGIPQ